MTIIRACELLGMPRSRYYRLDRGYQHYTPVENPKPQRERHQPAALTEEEVQQVLDVLLDPDLTEKSLVQAYWIGFDAKRLTCSQRQFYRIAKAQGLVGDRRRGRHSGGKGRPKPVVHATEPNQLWTWDISILTRLRRIRRYRGGSWRTAGNMDLFSAILQRKVRLQGLFMSPGITGM